MIFPFSGVGTALTEPMSLKIAECFEAFGYINSTLRHVGYVNSTLRHVDYVICIINRSPSRFSEFLSWNYEISPDSPNTNEKIFEEVD